MQTLWSIFLLFGTADTTIEAAVSTQLSTGFLAGAAAQISTPGIDASLSPELGLQSTGRRMAFSLSYNPQLVYRSIRSLDRPLLLNRLQTDLSLQLGRRTRFELAATAALGEANAARLSTGVVGNPSGGLSTGGLTTADVIRFYSISSRGALSHRLRRRLTLNWITTIALSGPFLPSPPTSNSTGGSIQEQLSLKTSLGLRHRLTTRNTQSPEASLIYYQVRQRGRYVGAELRYGIEYRINSERSLRLNIGATYIFIERPNVAQFWNLGEGTSLPEPHYLWPSASLAYRERVVASRNFRWTTDMSFGARTTFDTIQGAIRPDLFARTEQRFGLGQNREVVGSLDLLWPISTPWNIPLSTDGVLLASGSYRWEIRPTLNAEAGMRFSSRLSNAVLGQPALRQVDWVLFFGIDYRQSFLRGET